MSDSSLDDAELLAGDFSEDLRGRVKQELDPGERLLWVGRPVAEPPRSAVWLVIWGAVGGLALAVALASFVGFANDPRPPDGFRGDVPGLLKVGFSALAVGVVVLLGVGGALGARRSARAKREGTLYALTDRRAIIWTPEGRIGAIRVESVLGRRLVGVYRREFPDGSGDVWFKLGNPGHPEYEDYETTGFQGIADVRTVEERVRRTLLSAESRVS